MRHLLPLQPSPCHPQDHGHHLDPLPRVLVVFPHGVPLPLAAAGLLDGTAQLTHQTPGTSLLLPQAHLACPLGSRPSSLCPSALMVHLRHQEQHLVHPHST